MLVKRPTLQSANCYDFYRAFVISCPVSLEIRPGSRFSIFVTKDVVVPTLP